MAGERYIDKAVDALGDWLDANLTTQLRDVETDQGLAASSLANPVDIVRAAVPLDNRSPLVQIYDEGGEFAHPAGQRHDLMRVNCAIVVSHVAADVDLEAQALFMRRYTTALIQCLRQNDGVIATGVQAIVMHYESAAAQGDKAQTRRVVLLGVQVTVHTP